MLAEYGITAGRFIKGDGGGYATGYHDSFSHILLNDPGVMLLMGAIFAFFVYFIFVRG